MRFERVGLVVALVAFAACEIYDAGYEDGAACARSRSSSSDDGCRSAGDNCASNDECCSAVCAVATGVCS